MTKIINYLRASRAELAKVTWPTRNETIRYTVEVIIVSVVIAGFLGGIDWLLGKLLTFVI